MNKTEQRIAIAKIRGWMQYDHFPFGIGSKRSIRKWKSPNSDCIGQIDSPPDYLNDMNAIREACLWALDNLWDAGKAMEFARHLESRDAVHSFTHPSGAFTCYETANIIIRSTAEDWCYAFLKTSNLWKDEQEPEA